MDVLTSAPEVDDAQMINNRLRLANRTNASLRMKSSEQLKGCLRFPEPTPPEPTHAAGAPARAPVYTRTMLIQRRRNEKVQEEVDSEQRFLGTYGPKSF
jgi:hypothetical protein